MEKFVKFFQQSIKIDDNKIQPEHLNSIVLDFSTKVKLKQGWNLFQEGDPTDCLYLIKKGEIQLSKQVKQIFNKTTQNFDFEIDATHSDNHESLSPVSNKKGKIKHTLIDFVIVSQHEFIGAEDLFYNKKQRTYNAKCLSDVTLFSIQRSQLLKLINDYYFFKISMQKYAQSKHQHHIERVKAVIQSKKNVQETIKPYYQKPQGPTSSKDLTVSSNLEKVVKTKFQKQGSIQVQYPFSSTDLAPLQSKSKSKTVTNLFKKSFDSPQLNSVYFPANPTQVSMNNLQEQSTLSNIQYNQIPSLTEIDDGQKSISQLIYINNGVNNPHIKQQKNFEKKIHHTESIRNEKDENQQYLDSLKSTFQEMNYIRVLQNQDNNDQNTQSSIQNQFWFDQSMKNELSRKINLTIKEKDPNYSKKKQQTFKSNLETTKFGTLDKKLNKLISSKPKLISNVIGALPQIENNSYQNESPFLSSRKISDDVVISRHIKKQKTLISQPSTYNSTQSIMIPNIIKQEQLLLLKNESSNENENENDKRSSTPKGKYLVNYNELIQKCNTTNDGDEDYKFSSSRSIRKQSDGLKSNYQQLSPLKLRDYAKIKQQEQKNTEGITSIDNLESTQASKKSSISFAKTNYLTFSERNIGKKQQINNELSSIVGKKAFYQTKDQFQANSANILKKKQNDFEGSQTQRQEQSIFSNSFSKEFGSKSQKLSKKNSLLTFYKNQSNQHRKTTYDTCNLEEFV